MNAIGLFAGRGDVVVAMGVTFVLGMIVGIIAYKTYLKVQGWVRGMAGKR